MTMTMTADFLVTGGTGTLGRLVVPRLRDAGAKVRVLSRSAGDGVVGDLTTGAGIDEAVDGIQTIVHCAGSAKGDDLKARTLVRAAARAGVHHLVFISVVGADRVPVVSAMDRMSFGYYAAKLGAEREIERSGIPWTTLRATQFHDLTLTAVRQLAKLPVALVPAGVRIQPVDAREVADRLTELALCAPAGLVPDLGGPRVYGMDDLVRSYLRATGRRRPILPVRFAGGAYRAMRAGANLTPDGATGRRTWEDFLAERVSA
jgi:uncharacterized protein YbjT (DUF2867 family)